MSYQPVLAALVDSLMLPDHKQWVTFGRTLGRLYSDKGMPVDMSLAEVAKRTPGLTQHHYVAMISGVGSWLIEHKRNSGATEKSIERQCDANNKMVADYLKRGEVGLY